MAKQPPKKTDTFINQVIQEFYKLTTGDLPYVFDVPEELNIRNFYKKLHKYFYHTLEFSRDEFKLSKVINRRTITISLREQDEPS